MDAIEVQNLTKAYKLYSSPRDRLKEAFSFSRRKFHRDFYALNDVSFVVEKGQAFGIIGRNGSGKSTLLKIICGVLQPTSGVVRIHGRIAALLELGAGFNSEFTGRDNVFMSGALMGFSREEMDDRLPDIEAFAEIGEYINQPVKTYSSGMMVRLAFAVQALVEPEILVVDEALAVGDALFQKRCYQVMERLISNGTTLLFVSHDQESIRMLTHRSILLKDGNVKANGLSSEVILEYRRQLHEDEKSDYQNMVHNLNKKVSLSGIRMVTPSSKTSSERLSFGDLDAAVIRVNVFDKNDETKNVFYPGELIKIRITCEVYKELTHLNVGVRIRSKEGVKLYSWGTLNQDICMWKTEPLTQGFWNKKFKEGQTFDVELSATCTLGVNLYEIQAFVSEESTPNYGSQRMLHWRDEAAFFSVVINQREYPFGGLCDLRMKAFWDY
jgi:homopolymeric O-antigen transport system ATP-binding protein